MRHILIACFLLLSACGGTSSGTQPQPTSPIDIATARPIVISGKGNQTVSVNKWNGFAAIRITATGAGKFSVQKFDTSILDGSFTFVERVGDYSGTVWLDLLDRARTTRLDVKSSGTWELVILPPKDIGYMLVCSDCNSEYQGQGDDVVLIIPKTGQFVGDLPMRIDAPEMPFVSAWTNNPVKSNTLMGPKTGPSSSTVILPNNTLFLTVKANGPWKATITAKPK